MSFPLVTPPYTIQDPACACDTVSCQGLLPSSNQGKLIGPFEFGGALYTFSARPGTFDQVLYRNHLVVTKSTDGGANWTVQDEGNSPLAEGGPNSEVQFDAANGFLHIVFSSPAPGPHLFYIRFDLNTDSWGAAVDSGIVLGAASYITSCCSALQSDGVMVLFYLTGFDTAIHRTTISGQVWGAASVVVAVGSDCFAAPLDGSDTAYLVYRTTAAPPGGISAVAVDSGGNITVGPVAIDTYVPLRCTQALLFNGTLVIPYISTTSAAIPIAQRSRSAFYQSVSLVDLTSVSHDLHDGVIVPSTAKDTYIRAVLLGGRIYFIWSQYYLHDAPSTDYTVSMFGNTYDGTTVSEAFLVWNQILDPVACAAGLDQGDYYIEGISVVTSDDDTKIRVVSFVAANQDLQGGLAFFQVEITPCPKNAQGRLR